MSHFITFWYCIMNLTLGPMMIMVMMTIGTMVANVLRLAEYAADDKIGIGSGVAW